TLVVQAPPQITTQPSNQTVIEGQAATFTVAASGSNLTFQWYQNGSPIPGATGTSYVTPVTAIADSGEQFWCVVDNGFLPTATSSTATLTVSPIPPVFNASTLSIAKGEGVILTCPFGGTATLQAGSGTASPVTSGGSTIDYPLANTTYKLTVTYHGTTQVTLNVTVKAYTANTLYVANPVLGTVTRHHVD